MVRTLSPGPYNTNGLMTANRIRFRARTIDRWMTGQVTTAHQRLADVLNRDDVANGLLLAESVWIDEAPTASQDAEGLEFAAINVGRVLFAVPIEDRATPPRDAFAWVKKRPDRVRIGIAQYEIVGNIFVVESMALADTLALARPQFVPIGSATIRDLSVPDVMEEHNVVLVNRRLLDYIMPER